MHTPGHVLLNVAVLGSIVGHERAVVAGAIVPDLPIVILYLRERLRGTPDDIIWSVAYQRRGWLALIHGAHSLPLSLLAVLISALWHAPGLTAFFLSMAAHALCDLPLHVHDAHRHFFPFSEFRFRSPISYWDPRYHGRTWSLIEALGVTACAIYLYVARAAQWTLSPVLAAGLLGSVVVWYAVNYYRSFLRR